MQILHSMVQHLSGAGTQVPERWLLPLLHPPQADPNPLPQTLPCVGSQGIGKVLKIPRVGMSRQRTALNLWLGLLTVTEASWVALVIKNLPANARDVRDRGSIHGWGRSPG